MKIYGLDPETKAPISYDTGTPEGMAMYREFEKGERLLRQEYIAGGLWISTVFLMLDHAWGGGDPVLFGTMVFPPGSSGDLDCDRYCSYEDAMAGHEQLKAQWMVRGREAERLIRKFKIPLRQQCAFIERVLARDLRPPRYKSDRERQQRNADPEARRMKELMSNLSRGLRERQKARAAVYMSRMH